MRHLHLLIAAALVATGASGGFLAARFLAGDGVDGTQTGANSGSGSPEPQIAYWVAPMDPNYRRDEPGLSPMGMALVPVYEGEGSGAGGREPALQINPAIVNDLGVRTETVRRADLALPGARR